LLRFGIGDKIESMSKKKDNNFVGLPQVEGLDIYAFSRLFTDRTNSYKYIFFLSILDILSRLEFEVSSPISLREITIEMLTNAWYPNSYLNLSFGLQDQIVNKLKALNLQINEPKFNYYEKKYLRNEIGKQNLDNLMVGNSSLMRFVPFRLIRPFLSSQLGKIEIDNEVNKRIVPLANKYFNTLIADLRLSDTNELFNIEKLRNAYELIVMPQISLVTSQGFMPNWSYR